MRIVILGGTHFVGRAITEHLATLGHEVLVVHRGETEPADLVDVRHLHAERSELPGQRAALEAFDPDAAVDVSSYNTADARAAIDALPGGIRLVAISSGDVYRAYESLHAGRQTDPLPLRESAALRENRFVDGPSYENLEVEEQYLPRRATVLRLGAVYGPHDYQRRFDFVLRRLRAGRMRIPIGSGGFLFSTVYVHDVATAVAAALGNPAAAGEAFNVVERDTAPFRLFGQQILTAAGDAGAGAEFVQVPDTALPKDLEITGTISQHLLMDAAKVRSVLGWTETDRTTALAASVHWHLDNPPAEWDRDFSADDAALAAAVTGIP